MTDFRENPVYNFNYFTFVIMPQNKSPISDYVSLKGSPEQLYYIQVIFVFISKFQIQSEGPIL